MGYIKITVPNEEKYISALNEAKDGIKAEDVTKISDEEEYRLVIAFSNDGSDILSKIWGKMSKVEGIALSEAQLVIDKK